MTDRRIDLGPTGETVRENVAQLREAQNLTYAELSRRLKDAGNPIPPLGLRRIEAGERRVHVDDLIALAVVLKSSPAALLMPNTPERDDEVSATGVAPQPAHVLWKFIREGSQRTDRGAHVIAYNSGPEWWMNALEPDEYPSPAFFEALRKIGIRVPSQDGEHGDR